MGSILTLSARHIKDHTGQERTESSQGAVFVSFMTALALGIHGYHPYAEDGGVYMVGVKRLLNPALYTQWSEFATEHLRFSLFAPMVVGLVRALHLPLMSVWLLLYIATFWLTLFAAWLLVTRCHINREARYGAVALLAVWLTIPVAGTSLMLMDPYFSARSISTPCAIFAMVGLLDFMRSRPEELRLRRQGLMLCLAPLTLAALVHPLMAAYTLGWLMLLACQLVKRPLARNAGTLSVILLSFVTAVMLSITDAPETMEYREVALTRSYWFLSRWHWYEQFGLIAPVGILLFISIRDQRPGQSTGSTLAHTAAVAGTLATAIAFGFARANAANYIVARLQPLRVFQIVYIVMILALGALLGETVLKWKKYRWTLTFAMLAAIMILAERQVFPSSAHFELPWQQPTNNWQQAFVWIRNNTPPDALIALDAHYITAPGEDAQTFRALAERSALPDYSKDGGEASITPDLAVAWMAGQKAQLDLNTETDSRRLEALRPLAAKWLVLPYGATTNFACDYSNETVKVCRLPE